MNPPYNARVSDPIRVLLIDDHAVVRRGLRMLVESENGLVVVGEAQDRAGALPLAQGEQPDVIVLDLDLGAESGLDMIEDLLSISPGARILVLTGMRDLTAHRRAFNLGATGLVEKDSAAEVLVKAIRRVAGGEVWVDPAKMVGVLADASGPAVPPGVRRDDPEAARIAQLSARELEVTALIGEGLCNKKIGERLSITETTVRHHLTSIFSKLKVHDRLELLLYAYRHRILKPPTA
jgi:two-component system, NarL family, nitrate/nitrite response regulator NarL